ncbi:hypothetical protein PARPLA_00631 [Rhodobacteraceae bacterium THAF1]|uniref:hypothetical protein n=1 Tax=Palleronia sp. THAF1 TaxID=2587842 RepID=UPI000F3E1550|nr:hypothetical protein [Palleronia sp. THAF1]QFU09806.1 hypothetical protein FIU81_14105 [Palleronia sp. THAF1]VDC17291.1 hypothetical protein PARPLA_00631 [Rhodobacteraceae bacterium THAF1]
MIRTTALVLCAALASPAVAAPNAQLTNSIAQRLDRVGIQIIPERLTNSQAAALHMMLVSTRGYVEKRRKAKAILRNPDFLD